MKIINELGDFKVDSFPIALVVSQFSQDITYALKDGALARLVERGIATQDILIVEVPGAVEIPVVAKQLAMQTKACVIIALGAVIRGETTHYDYVCQQVSEGCQRVALDHQIPVIFGVLTTENEAQAQDRVGGAHGHKGISAADAAIQMYLTLEKLKR